MAMGFSADTKMGELLDHPGAHEVLLKHLPKLKNAGPMLNMARGLTLTAISRFPQADISPEKLQTIVSEIEKL